MADTETRRPRGGAGSAGGGSAGNGRSARSGGSASSGGSGAGSARGGGGSAGGGRSARGGGGSKGPNPLQKLAESQVIKSIFRTGIPRSRRQRMMGVLNNVFLHLHPVRLPKHAVKVKYTWCMGGLSFFIFLVLTITGILLMFYYRPTVEAAYGDIIDLGSQVPLGIMREIHRWGAHLMVITVWLHMFRVFMTGSYKPPREFNWLIGVMLLTLTMFLSYTGYLLPWDQLAIWAVTVGANMARAAPFLGHEGPGASLLSIGDVNFVHAGADAKFALLGGRFLGEATLLRFYVLHCIGVPFIVMILMIVHFWRIRKDGGISGPT